MKPGLGRSRKQGDILPVTYKFEIHQCPDDPSLGYIHVHYRLIVRTNGEDEEDFVFATDDLWNENDLVSVIIPKDKIRLSLKAEDKKK